MTDPFAQHPQRTAVDRIDTVGDRAQKGLDLDGTVHCVEKVELRGVNWDSKSSMAFFIILANQLVFDPGRPWRGVRSLHC